MLLRLHDLSTYRDMPAPARRVSDFAMHSCRTFGAAHLPIILGYTNEIARQIAGLECIAAQKVWSLYAGDWYAQVPLLDDQGTEVLYPVIFSLDPFKGRSTTCACWCARRTSATTSPPDTYGEVKFSSRMKLRVSGEAPSEGHRPWP